MRRAAPREGWYAPLVFAPYVRHTLDIMLDNIYEDQYLWTREVGSYREAGVTLESTIRGDGSRPSHSSLNGMTPEEFAKQKKKEHPNRGTRLETDLTPRLRACHRYLR